MIAMDFGSPSALCRTLRASYGDPYFPAFAIPHKLFSQRLWRRLFFDLKHNFARLQWRDGATTLTLRRLLMSKAAGLLRGRQVLTFRISHALWPGHSLALHCYPTI